MFGSCIRIMLVKSVYLPIESVTPHVCAGDARLLLVKSNDILIVMIVYCKTFCVPPFPTISRLKSIKFVAEQKTCWNQTMLAMTVGPRYLGETYFFRDERHLFLP